MITPIQAVIAVLKGNIKTNDVTVPVIKRSYPLDKTPCITLENSGGTITRNKWRLNLPFPLPEEHPQFDKDNPNAEYPQDVLKTEKSTTVNIHVWTDNETEREEINNQIIDCFRKVESDHYMFCSNYSNGNCKTTDSTCEAIDNIFSRDIKNQCPKPSEYKYENIFKKYNLVREKCNIESPFDVDDLNTEPITLHSVFEFNAYFYDYYVIGGNISENIK